jgi:hypothetical protein
MNRFECLILAAFCFNVIDVVLTIVLTRGLGLIEINPIMALLLSHAPLTFAGVKIGVVGIICVILQRRQKRDVEMAHFALGVVVGMLSMICLWQIAMLLWAI